MFSGAVVELEWPGHFPKPDIHAVKEAVRVAVEDADVDASRTNSPLAVHASFVPTHHGLLQVVVLQRAVDGDEAEIAAAAIERRLQGVEFNKVHRACHLKV